MAVKYNVNVIAGSHFVVEEGTLYNIAYLFGRDGSIGKQYKLHITPSEKKWWGVTPGNKVEVFDTDCGKVAIQICCATSSSPRRPARRTEGGPNHLRPLQHRHPSRLSPCQACAQARCIENHLYVATSGCTGNLPFVENADIHYAQSGIYTPADIEFARDAIAAECNPNVETMIIHDLDVDLLRHHRESGSVQNWNDRRTDFYGALHRKRPGPLAV
ncbi:MAG: nitrilase-related carbon-nitrogen hydrolase [Planctomycetaceae bacterium]